MPANLDFPQSHRWMKLCWKHWLAQSRRHCAWLVRVSIGDLERSVQTQFVQTEQWMQCKVTAAQQQSKTRLKQVELKQHHDYPHVA